MEAKYTSDILDAAVLAMGPKIREREAAKGAHDAQARASNAAKLELSKAVARRANRKELSACRAKFVEAAQAESAAFQRLETANGTLDAAMADALRKPAPEART